MALDHVEREGSEAEREAVWHRIRVEDGDPVADDGAVRSGR